MKLQIITHEVSIQEMVNRIVASFTDLITDATLGKRTDELEDGLVEYSYMLKVMSIGDINAIRELFKAGNTMMMLPSNIFEYIDDPSTPLHEIRIFDNELLLGVIIDSEIKY